MRGDDFYELELLGVLDESRAPLEDRRFLTLCGVLAALVAGYAGATLAGASSVVLSLFFLVPMVPVPVVAWWATVRAPAEQRTMWALLASAASLWMVGLVVWYAVYAANGNTIPDSPGPWDVEYVAAFALSLAGYVLGFRRAIRLRHVALDAAVAIAAALAVGTALVAEGLTDGLSPALLVALARPIFGILTLAVIVSAALGAWEGLPLSTVLLGAGQLPMIGGHLVYSYAAVQGNYVDDRWTDLCWATGATLFILAAATVILRLDRPVRPSRTADIPNHPLGARAMLSVALGALLVTVGVAAYGEATETHVTFVAGLTAGAAVATAMALRARNAVREVELAYAELDRAHAAEQRANDALTQAIAELDRTNMGLRVAHLAVGDVLTIIDERTGGGLRAHVEDAGEDVVALLADLLDERAH